MTILLVVVVPEPRPSLRVNPDLAQWRPFPEFLCGVSMLEQRGLRGRRLRNSKSSFLLICGIPHIPLPLFSSCLRCTHTHTHTHITLTLRQSLSHSLSTSLSLSRF